MTGHQEIYSRIEKHHHKISYQNEYIQFLKQIGIEFDRQHLWQIIGYYEQNDIFHLHSVAPFRGLYLVQIFEGLTPPASPALVGLFQRTIKISSINNGAIYPSTPPLSHLKAGHTTSTPSPRITHRLIHQLQAFHQINAGHVCMISSKYPLQIQ